MARHYNTNRYSRRNFLQLILGFLTLFVVTISADDQRTTQRQTQTRSCRSISEIICETTAFASFCEILEETGLEGILGTSDDVWTVFIPTNAALDKFGIYERSPTANNSNNGTDSTDNELVDLLFFHTIQDRLVRGADLTECGETFTMSGGEKTTVVCGENGGRSVYLSGRGNMVGMLPQVVITDVVACNGLIHVINGVLRDDPLPQLVPTIQYSGEEHDQRPEELDIQHSDEECQSVQEIICEREELTTMCVFLDDENIVESSTSTNGLWTVFAPTDTGFDDIQDVLGDMSPDEILDILQFHTIPGEELFSDQLVCDTDLIMGNAGSSRTTCSSMNIFQEGPGNALLPMRNHPRIIEADLTACNGVVHIVDHVMIPEHEMTAMVGRTGVYEREETRKEPIESNPNRPNSGIASASQGGGWAGRRPGRIGKPLRQVLGNRMGGNRL